MSQLALPFSTPTAESTPPTPEFRRFLERLPPAMASGLTPEERAAYAAALIPQRSPHWLDLKASLPIPGCGIYIALMVGRERRNPVRLSLEGQRRLGPNLLATAILLATGVTGWLAAVLVIKGLQSIADSGHHTWWPVYAAPF